MTDEATARGRVGRFAAVGAVVLAVAAAGWLAAWPCFYRGVSASGAPGGPVRTRLFCDSLIGENGTWVIWLLLLPVALSLVAALASRAGIRPAAWACAIVALAFCVLSAFSIGAFYLPSAIAMTVAAATARRRRRERSPSAPPAGG
jgi:hypothetical protein